MAADHKSSNGHKLERRYHFVTQLTLLNVLPKSVNINKKQQHKQPTFGFAYLSLHLNVETAVRAASTAAVCFANITPGFLLFVLFFDSFLMQTESFFNNAPCALPNKIWITFNSFGLSAGRRSAVCLPAWRNQTQASQWSLTRISSWNDWDTSTRRSSRTWSLATSPASWTYRATSSPSWRETVSLKSSLPEASCGHSTSWRNEVWTVSLHRVIAVCFHIWEVLFFDWKLFWKNGLLEWK